MARFGRGFPLHPLIVKALARAGAVLSGTAADSVSVSDAASRAAQSSSRAGADSAPVSDSAARSAQTSSRTAADTVSVSDAAARSGQTPHRTAADSVSVSDAASRSAQASSRTASDSVPVSDAAPETKSSKSVADTVPVSDSASRSTQSSSRTGSDTVSVSDAASRSAQSRSRSAADTVPVSDGTAARSEADHRGPSDTVAISDSASRSAQASSRTAADSVPVSDSNITGSDRVAADTVPVSDVASRSAQTVGRTSSDAFTVSDSAARSAQARARSTADSVPVSDTVTSKASKSTTDTVPVSDAASRSAQAVSRTGADTVAVSDTASRSAQATSRTAADAFTVSDSVAKSMVPTRSASDTVAISDSATRAAQGVSRTAADSLSISDSPVGNVVGSGIAATLANPNWPLMGFDIDFASGPPNLPGGSRRSINARAQRLYVRKFSTTRGRQYELDQVQAGTATLEVPDPTEALNPNNLNSPFNGQTVTTTTGGTFPGASTFPGSSTYPGAGTTTTTRTAGTLVPYRAMWVWGMWPNQPGSGNIINPNVSSAFDPSFETTNGGWLAAGGSTTAVQSTAQHHGSTGTHSLLVTQSAAGSGFGVVNHFPTAPDVTYTFSAWVYPTSGSVYVAVLDGTGTWQVCRAPATALNTWTRIYVAWNPVDTLEGVYIYGTGATTPTFYVDECQLEFGSNLTTYQSTGPALYPIFTGYTERFPTTYDMNGIRAQRPMVAVDALAVLSRAAIAQQYDTTISSSSPTALIPLDNSAAPTTAGQYGTGSGAQPIYLIPQSSSVQWGGDSLPDGTKAVVVTQQNPTTPPSRAGTGNDTFVQSLAGKLALSTTGASVEFWLRPTAGAFIASGLWVAPVGTNWAIAYNLSPEPVELSVHGGDLGSGSMYVKYLGVAGGAQFTQNMPVPAGSPGDRYYADNQWHYVCLWFAADGSLNVQFDGQTVNAGILSGQPAVIGFTQINQMSASTGFGYPQAQFSQAKWAFYGRALSASERTAHYMRGIGYSGQEYLGQRAKRLLDQYWAGPYSAATGRVQLADDFSYNTRTLLDVLQEMCETERGLVYADRNGTVQVEDRRSRYSNQQPLWTFGEDPTNTGAELPYQDIAFDFDPTYVFSQADLTRPGNSDIAPMVNSSTQSTYGQRILTQTLQVTRDFDVAQAGIHYLQRYSAAKYRVAKLTLKPSANPALWPVVLTLDISQRIRVVRRTPALTTTLDYYVEKVDHRVDAESGDWTTELQCSPVFVPSAWICGDATYGVLGSTTTPVY